MDFARRVFLAIRSGFSYEYRLGMDWRASAVAQARKSDCGGLSILFVSIMRANGIPARTLYGRWAASARPADQLSGAPYYQTHVKAEFFGNGVGWVPVDVASAILHDRSREGLRYFGQDAGDFLTFHVDPNLLLDTGLFGMQPLHNLQTPAWWLRGSGTLEPRSTSEDWQVRPLK
ncbi:MAG: transglutaminase domain-containing protein [Planctomycetes bacterium]|nr:transglutaminase domain-containing protein [Planctomycetota bacterium]